MSIAHASRWKLVALVAVLALVWFANLDARKLIRPDEGRYAEIAREMAVTGDWVTPRLNGIKYFEKPPLQYWITAAAYRVFGPDEWTARLWAGVSGAAVRAARLARGHAPVRREAGAYAGLVATGMLWMVANAHLNTLDMGLTLWLTLGVAGFLWAQRDAASPRERRNGMLLSWAACALAVLTKGLIGIVLPGGAIGVYMLAARDFRLLGRLHLRRRHRRAAGHHRTLVHRRVARESGVCAVLLRARAFPALPDRRAPPATNRGGTSDRCCWRARLPWTLLAIQSVATATRGDANAGRFRPRLFLLIWCVFVVLFFSVSKSKLPSYILPVFPALAWLMGDRLARVPAKIARVARGVAAAARRSRARARPAGSSAMPTRARPRRCMRPSSRGFSPRQSSMAVAAIAGIVFARRDRRTAAIVALSAGGLVSWQLAITGHDALSPFVLRRAFRRRRTAATARRLSAVQRENLRPDAALLPRPHGDAGRLRRRDGNSDSNRSRQLALPTIEAFAETWRATPCSYAFMETETHAELVAAGLPMTVIASDTRRVMVRNAALEAGPAP